jgi:hypothetical protein
MRQAEWMVSVTQYSVMLVSSSSLLNRDSMSPLQSLQLRNFSTIHALRPAGESLRPKAEGLRLGGLLQAVRALRHLPSFADGEVLLLGFAQGVPAVATVRPSE